MAGGDIGNGDVAEPVDGVDGLRVAPGLLAVVAAHAVAFTLHVDNVKEEVEARGEVAAPDELLGLAQLVLVDEDGDAHGLGMRRRRWSNPGHRLSKYSR